MKILVLGGAGYIGSHVSKAIAARGDTPIVFDNLSAGHRDFVCWGPLVEGDIRDGDALDQPVTRRDIHCAGGTAGVGARLTRTGTAR